MNIKKIKSMLIAVVTMCLLVAADQFTKYLAVKNLQHKISVKLIPGFLSLTYVENPGSAWGMMQNMQWLVIIISFVLVIGVFIYYYRLSDEKKFIPLKIALTVLAAGALGNAIDRITKGIVVDFFEFKFINFPVFNVADIYVVLSVIIIFILILFVYKEEDFAINRKGEV